MGVGEEAGANDGSPEGLRASNMATFALQTQSSSSSLENALERGETGDRDQEDSYCMTKRQGGECGGGKMGKEGGSLGRPALSAGRDQPLPGPDSLSAFSPGCRLSGPRSLDGALAPSTAAQTQMDPILQKPMPGGCLLPVSLEHLATAPVMGPYFLQPRKPSATWALLTVTLTPTTPASAGGGDTGRDVSQS